MIPEGELKLSSKSEERPTVSESKELGAIILLYVQESSYKAEWAIDSEPMRARGIIVLVKSN